MSARFKRWLPIGLCCAPGIAIAVFVGASVLLGGASAGAALRGPLGLGMGALAMLACPLSMGLMLWRNNRNAPEGMTNNMACCVPDDNIQPAPSTARLAQLVARREALERELTVTTGES